MSTEKNGGYGKPPKAHQWQPGQSGNPSGKKKAAAKTCLPLPEMFAEELARGINFSENGKSKMAPTARALVRTYIHNTLKAPLKQQGEAIKLLIALGVIDIQNTSFENYDDDFVPPFSETERRYIKFMQDCINGEEDASFDEGTR